MQETRVQFLGREDTLEKEMAIHSSTTAWKISWTGEPGRLHVVHGVTKSPAASLVAQRLKRLPAMQETWVRSLVWEDPLEKEMATHASILAWRTPGRRSLVGYSPQSCKESDTTERLHFHFLAFNQSAENTRSLSKHKSLDSSILSAKNKII